MTAFRLLLSDDENDAAELAKTIDTYNKERHSVENEITKAGNSGNREPSRRKICERHSGVG